MTYKTVKTVKVSSLLGQNVAGLKAQVTGRHYVESGTAKERIRTLRHAYRERDKHTHNWFIYIFWEPIAEDGRYDCGFSGMEENAAERNNWSIELMED